MSSCLDQLLSTLFFESKHTCIHFLTKTRRLDKLLDPREVALMERSKWTLRIYVIFRTYPSIAHIIFLFQNVDLEYSLLWLFHILLFSRLRGIHRNSAATSTYNMTRRTIRIVRDRNSVFNNKCEISSLATERCKKTY